MHIPVMKDEVVSVMRVRKGGMYMDCTFGQGGHARAILSKGGVVLAIDRDAFTCEYAKEIKEEFPETFFWVHSSFANLKNIWNQYVFPMKVDGVLFDLGFSSNQIEAPDRGFSFLYDSNLDMRYDIQENTQTALDLLNRMSEEKLSEIFYEFGEEKAAKKIAAAIYAYRGKKQFESSFELLEVLKTFNSLSTNKHFATKIFQALRIYVNDELSHINKAIQAAFEIVKFYGRIVVITFHSLEDRIIKNAFINKNLMFPSENEINMNPRARSAKLRWFVRSEGELC